MTLKKINISNILFHLSSSLVAFYNKYRFFFISIFFLSLFLVFLESFLMAVESSIDIQWFPAKLFWNGINPYYEHIQNKTMFLAQKPNYSHLLYIVLYPLAILDWEIVKVIWASGSIITFILTLVIFNKSQISEPFLLFSTFFLLWGTPLANVISNGQITIYIMFFTSLAWYYKDKSFLITTISLAFVFTKYSFGLPILMGFFLAGYYSQVTYALLINIIAVIIFCIKFNIKFLECLLMPFIVSGNHRYDGPIDIMSINYYLSQYGIIELNFSYILIPVIFASFIFIIIFNKKIFNSDEIISLSIFLSLITFFHLIYDHVMLLCGILFLKSYLKSSNLNFAFIFVIYIFLVFGTKVLYFLDIKFFSDYHNYSLYFALIYAITFSSLVVIFVFQYVFGKILKNKT